MWGSPYLGKKATSSEHMDPKPLTSPSIGWLALIGLHLTAKDLPVVSWERRNGKEHGNHYNALRVYRVKKEWKRKSMLL